MARGHAGDLPPEYDLLADMVRWAETGGRWPRTSSDHPGYFYTLRAADTPDRDLVNMLLAELCPLDLRQMFICHKALFYRSYRSWPEEKKAYAASFLATEYAVDKAGARTALFGHEPGMAEPEPAQVQPKEGLIQRVGPWGAVRRR
jgi:hypothetical protein